MKNPERLTIEVADYYGRRELYPAMPPEIFAALEKAFLAGEKTADVDPAAFAKMEADFKAWMAR